MYKFNPYNSMTVALAGWRMFSEAQTVIAYRLMGMAGLWAVAPTENARMISEKGPALLAAQSAAIGAALRGKGADEIYSAWLGPIGKETRANQKRLSKLGFHHG